ncbi:hypothetical protein PGTUg99_016297 [Puccinia graminis f. sp. tritici]|uniref:Uncharacterized protein n=1 Tax=Puccinia graminis f. sp. tritici TaxID=56615 RepID=A0A5B0LK34_PUCGR|nr:hypothetical protein PGTUg99_016297 [Puccinia graminis f. sp. tritici]
MHITWCASAGFLPAPSTPVCWFGCPSHIIKSDCPGRKKHQKQLGRIIEHLQEMYPLMNYVICLSVVASVLIPTTLGQPVDRQVIWLTEEPLHGCQIVTIDPTTRFPWKPENEAVNNPFAPGSSNAAETSSSTARPDPTPLFNFVGMESAFPNDPRPDTVRIHNHSGQDLWVWTRAATVKERVNANCERSIRLDLSFPYLLAAPCDIDRRVLQHSTTWKIVANELGLEEKTSGSSCNCL